MCCLWHSVPEDYTCTGAGGSSSLVVGCRRPQYQFGNDTYTEQSAPSNAAQQEITHDTLQYVEVPASLISVDFVAASAIKKCKYIEFQGHVEVSCQHSVTGGLR